MSTLLICSVGGTPQPVVRSLREEPRPDKVVFVCSPQSERSVTAPAGPPQAVERPCACGQLHHECVNPAGILALAADCGATIPEGAYKIVTVSDSQNLTACLRDMEDHLGPIVDAWLRSGPEQQLVVDPTGGTKCMSAALGIVARRWRCVLRYIGGESRTRGGVGVVEDSTEKVFHCDNPLDALGYRAAEDAITLCSRMNFGAAAQLLLAATYGVSDPDARNGLRALQSLTTFFSLWDLFAHSRALSQLHVVKRFQGHLARHLSADSVAEVTASIKEWEARLKKLSTSKGPTLELVEDLLSNADRRREEDRYDDAVGRLYRAIESIAQCRLASEHGIPQTGRVPLESVPEPLRSELAGHHNGTYLKLGLQEAYRLLNALGDDLGRRFCSSRLADRKASPLVSRNISILAHGFDPVSPVVCTHLWKDAMNLAGLIGISGDRLFRFPVLNRHGG